MIKDIFQIIPQQINAMSVPELNALIDDMVRCLPPANEITKENITKWQKISKLCHVIIGLNPEDLQSRKIQDGIKHTHPQIKLRDSGLLTEKTKQTLEYRMAMAARKAETAELNPALRPLDR